MPHPLYVAFLWHMHQPFYRDASTGDFALPWTRLHATKDYLHMAEVLSEYPAIHATFNFVPSLIEQLEDYADGNATDRALRTSLKEHLSASDKEFVLSFFFSINWDRVINHYPGYRELLRQRQEAQGDWRRFSDQYWTDLIVWFNLAWFDPTYVRSDPDLRVLADKGSGFTRADVHLVADKSRNVAGPTLAVYRRLADRGQIELCTSPYYHPILPLLVDGASARQATPGIVLPPELFAYPEDAMEQIRRGLLAHQRIFGRPAQGMWPSEGAVSQGVAHLIAAQTDLKWIASDEAILGRSLGVGMDRDGYGHLTRPSILYQPYTLTTRHRQGNAPPLSAIFRDRLLADRIGFVYQHMDGRSAAEDLVDRLRRARINLGDDDQPHLLSIILDGENCWEYYENNGEDFLRHLYTLLSAADDIKTVTVSEYLARNPPRSTITQLAAGSWIGGDMLTWIGEPAQNQAWEYLARTREQLVSRSEDDHSTSMDVVGQAWQELYIAEGSDWFWWYSTRNTPPSNVFDALFRGHLAEVYRNLGLPAPDWLSRPIVVTRGAHAGRSPKAYVTPDLMADSNAGYAWANAGVMEPELSSATMQRGESALRRLYYGFDATHLYLRLEINPVAAISKATLYISAPRARCNRTAPLLHPRETEATDGLCWSHELTIDVPARTVTLKEADGYEGWRSISPRVDTAFATTICEVCMPLSGLRLRLNDNAAMVLLLGRDGTVEERQPAGGFLGFRLSKQGE
jgi:alpha-amylase/alpha-mannosidase (GH57 family)